MAPGVGLIELLIAMAITVVLLGAAFSFFDDMESMTEQVSVMSQVNESLRGSADLITKDIYAAGTSIPTGGIPIPWTTGSTNSLAKRPGPASAYFPGNNGILSVITAGYQLSGAIGGAGIYSDEVTMIAVDENWVGLAPLTISSMSSASSTGYTVNVTIPAPGCTISTTPPIFDCTLGPQGYNVNKGDLLMFSTPGGLNALGMVTSVDTTANIIYFAADPMSLNQVCGSAATCVGSIDGLGQPAYSGVYPSGMSLTKIDMISYYIDNTNAAHPDTLMREIGGDPVDSPPIAVAYGIDNLQFTYDMTTGGSTNCTGGAEPSSCAAFAPNEIGKVNLLLDAISQNPLRKGKRYYGNRFYTAVTVRNLEYVNQFP